MRNYVIINGVNSLTIQGLAINNLPPITKPMIRTQREEIDGRDGDIVTELGYSAYDKQIEIGLWGTYDINDIIKYFTGEGTIVFSNEEDKYYNFKILDQIDYQKLLKFKTATITFHCQPFKYPLEEEPVEAEITTLTGTGETLTLNNTEEAPMSLVYKGNTYQDSTTGKNLLANSLTKMKTDNTTGTWNNNAYTLNGIVFTPVYENDMLQYINVNGTATAQTDFIIGETPLINGTTYIGTGCPSGGSTTTYRIFYTYIGADYGTGVMLTSTVTVSSLATARVYSGATVNNLKFYPMVRLSSITEQTYEPYTNGASPNPDYPQDIHVVSGDNEISITGKNLLDPNSFAKKVIDSPYSAYNISTYDSETGELNIMMGNGAVVFDNFKSNTQYTFIFKYNSTTNATNLRIDYTNGTNQNISVGSGGGSGTIKIVSVSGRSIKQIVHSAGDSSGSRILYLKESGIFEGVIEETEFESFGKVYPISLGVENIATTYKSSGSGYFNYSYDNSKVSKNMTLSFMPNFTTTGATIYARPKDNGALYTLGTISTITSGVKASLSFTLTDAQITEIKANTGGFFQIYRTNVEFTESSVSDIQLSEGSTPQHVSTNPIQLLHIPNTNYYDKIDKSSGKNLFDLKAFLTERSVSYTENSDGSLTFSLEPALNTNKYSFSDTDIYVSISALITNVTSTNCYIELYNSNGSRVARLSDSNTSANNVSACKIAFNWASTGNAKVMNLMLNKGTTALPYEPYGTGWYVKKEIGKVVLDGSESWTNYTNLGNNSRCYYIKPNAFSLNSQLFSNYFIKSNLYETDETGIIINPYGTSLISIKIPNSDLETQDLAGYKTWLGTHNTIVYYVLATPTYTLIEDSTLIEELESMKKSYEGQTNISQTNNDLPFELDVSVTFLTPMEINNIGNIYAKPILTIEGTGNIGVVLNDIQILDIDLTNNGKIAIDVTKLEAYNPDDDTLLNRLVTGDYMKLLINEGENTITFTGNVSGATLTNYIRWI